MLTSTGFLFRDDENVLQLIVINVAQLYMSILKIIKLPWLVHGLSTGL